MRSNLEGIRCQHMNKSSQFSEGPTSTSRIWVTPLYIDMMSRRNPEQAQVGSNSRSQKHEGGPAADASTADDDDERLAHLLHALLAEEDVVAGELRTEQGRIGPSTSDVHLSTSRRRALESSKETTPTNSPALE